MTRQIRCNWKIWSQSSNLFLAQTSKLIFHFLFDGTRQIIKLSNHKSIHKIVMQIMQVWLQHMNSYKFVHNTHTLVTGLGTTGNWSPLMSQPTVHDFYALGINHGMQFRWYNSYVTLAATVIYVNMHGKVQFYCSYKLYILLTVCVHFDSSLIKLCKAFDLQTGNSTCDVMMSTC